MNALISLTGFVLLGYFLGSISFAVVVSKAFGLADPRTFGSGNPGATNVLRSGNKAAALLTLIGDAFKGWLAMWLARQLGADDLGFAAAGIAAFFGHAFPVFLKFKGGKGVATALGVLACFSGWLALICAGTWLLVAVVSRYSSLAALIAALISPIAAAALGLGNEALVAITVMSAMLVWRHHENIRRLLSGTESKLGRKKKSQ